MPTSLNVSSHDLFFHLGDIRITPFFHKEGISSNLTVGPPHMVHPGCGQPPLLLTDVTPDGQVEMLLPNVGA